MSDSVGFHAFADAPMPRRIGARLDARGILWLSDHTRVADRIPTRSVLDAIAGAAGLVVLATTAACKSRQVKEEVAHVLAAGLSEQIAVIAWQMDEAAVRAAWPALPPSLASRTSILHRRSQAPWPPGRAFSPSSSSPTSSLSGEWQGCTLLRWGD